MKKQSTEDTVAEEGSPHRIKRRNSDVFSYNPKAIALHKTFTQNCSQSQFSLYEKGQNISARKQFWPTTVTEDIVVLATKLSHSNCYYLHVTIRLMLKTTHSTFRHSTVARFLEIEFSVPSLISPNVKSSLQPDLFWKFLKLVNLETTIKGWASFSGYLECNFAHTVSYHLHVPENSSHNLLL